MIDYPEKQRQIYEQLGREYRGKIDKMERQEKRTITIGLLSILVLATFIILYLDFDYFLNILIIDVILLITIFTGNKGIKNKYNSYRNMDDVELGTKFVNTDAKIKGNLGRVAKGKIVAFSLCAFLFAVSSACLLIISYTTKPIDYTEMESVSGYIDEAYLYKLYGEVDITLTNDDRTFTVKRENLKAFNWDEFNNTASRDVIIHMYIDSSSDDENEVVYFETNGNVLLSENEVNAVRARQALTELVIGYIIAGICVISIPAIIIIYSIKAKKKAEAAGIVLELTDEEKEEQKTEIENTRMEAADIDIEKINIVVKINKPTLTKWIVFFSATILSSILFLILGFIINDLFFFLAIFLFFIGLSPIERFIYLVSTKITINNGKLTFKSILSPRYQMGSNIKNRKKAEPTDINIIRKIEIVNGKYAHIYDVNNNEVAAIPIGWENYEKMIDYFIKRGVIIQ